MGLRLGRQLGGALAHARRSLLASTHKCCQNNRMQNTKKGHKMNEYKILFERHKNIKKISFNTYQQLHRVCVCVYVAE